MPLPPSLPKWISASIPKIGNRAEENEDAVAADGLRFVVADGASEGWESGAWATRLGAAYIRQPPSPSDFPKWLAEVREGWAPQTSAGPVPWYASVKQEQGSFATLTGLELRRSQRSTDWAWRSVAIGDSCMLHVRGEELQAAFPLTSPKAFGNHPCLVPSSTTTPCPTPEWFAGRADPDDLLLLATDAAAARLLDPPALIPALAAIHESLRFRDPAALVDWCREVQTTTNDDVSVIAIHLPPAQETL
ncbi:MAG: protein phosphatase 2C domain-containing protein [Planctomycetia bacterium]|nr:protein phosphatase 2C domain-containing protein [Planctomycetia bacterium]